MERPRRRLVVNVSLPHPVIKTIMALEASQTEDPLNQPPHPANHYGAVTEETCYQCFTPLTCNQGIEAVVSRLFQRKRSELHAK